jgi:hypothetical protein
VARPERFELPTLCFEGRCSIQLSYGRIRHNDSKSFIASKDTILAALNFCRKGRRISRRWTPFAILATLHQLGVSQFMYFRAGTTQEAIQQRTREINGAGSCA